MNYSEFKHTMIDGLVARLPEGTSVELKQVCKNNGRILDGVSILLPDENLAPTVYLEQYYLRYREGEPFGELLEEIAGVPLAYRIDAEEAESLFDPAYIIPRIRVRAVNDAWNRGLLQDKPHRRVFDLSLLCYWTPDIGFMRDGFVSVRYGDLDNLNLSETELLDLALKQSEEEDPCRLIPMTDFVPVHTDRSFTDPLYVLTTERKIFGARALFYRDAPEMIMSCFSEDCYILPSSVHECIVVRSFGQDPGELSGMVSEINRKVVDPQEVLSDNIYQFRYSTGTISPAGK